MTNTLISVKEKNNQEEKQNLLIPCGVCSYPISVPKAKVNACFRCPSCGEQTCS